MYVDAVGYAGFTGNITNSGSISSGSEYGMVVESVASDGKFSGSILNSGSITSYSGTACTSTPQGIVALPVRLATPVKFPANMASAFTLTRSPKALARTLAYLQFRGNHSAVRLRDVHFRSGRLRAGASTGSILNSGTISSYYDAMLVEYVGASGFAGNIFNSGDLFSQERERYVSL